MQILTEGDGPEKLTFEFPDDWQVIKYDDDNGFYKQQVIKAQGTKALDFLVIDTTYKRQLWFEVKNFRGYHTENQFRLDANESNVPGLHEVREYIETNNWDKHLSCSRRKPFLPDEVVQKVCGTCAGLVGAGLQGLESFGPFLQALDSNLPLHIVLFLHQDKALEDLKDSKVKAIRIAGKIRQQLAFLKAEVEVVTQSTISKNAGWCVPGNPYEHETLA